MNLVSYEYIASQEKRHVCVLILSEGLVFACGQEILVEFTVVDNKGLFYSISQP